MVRRRLIVPLVLVLLPIAAEAQTANSEITGFATASIGVARGGTASDGGLTLGGSVAIVEASGIGAEVDLSHAFSYDSTRFRESGITTLMVNVAGVWRDPLAPVRPYVVAGVGLLRTRGCAGDCQVVLSRTDWAFDAGGGAFVLINETFGVAADVRYFRHFQRDPLLSAGYFHFWRASVGATMSWPVK